MKHKISILILIVLTKVTICQTDTLNKFNQAGKKHGYWLKYLDLNVNPIDSANSYFYGYELYDNGYKVIGFFKDKSKKNKVLHYNSVIPTKGRPSPVEGVFKWHNKDTKDIHLIETYSKGNPIKIEYYKKYKREKDTIPRIIECIDYTSKYNQEPLTYSYKFYSSRDKFDLYYFRKVENKWRFHKVK